MSRGLYTWDDLPAAEAALKSWVISGREPRYHAAAKSRVRREMPLLARALDRMALELHIQETAIVCSHCIQIVSNGECTCWDCSFEPPERQDAPPMSILKGIWVFDEDAGRSGGTSTICDGCGAGVPPFGELFKIARLGRSGE